MPNNFDHPDAIDDHVRAAFARALRAPASLDPRASRASTPISNGTDLPLPQSGSSGSRVRAEQAPRQLTAAELLDAIDRTLAVPAAPPLHDVSPGAVVAWVEEASRALVFRRERRRLLREVLRLLEDEWATRQQLDRLAEQVAARDEDERARVDGSYWRRRESGRRSQRPIRVEVEPDAWATAKRIASEHCIGLGEYVGELVASLIDRPEALDVADGASGLDRLFVRIAVDTTRWAMFVRLAQAQHLTAARLVGLVVERAAETRGHRAR